MKKIFYCIKCDMEEVSQPRLALGYNICLTCGDEEAKKEIEKKTKRIAIAYPNGAYQYITGGPETAKDFG